VEGAATPTRTPGAEVGSMTAGAVVVVLEFGGKPAAFTREAMTSAQQWAIELGLGTAQTAAVTLPEPESLLDAKHLAKALGIGRKRVETMGRRGDIPSVLIGQKSRRYSLQEVRARLAANTQGGT
jgi:hypothetical protein